MSKYWIIINHNKMSDLRDFDAIYQRNQRQSNAFKDSNTLQEEEE